MSIKHKTLLVISFVLCLLMMIGCGAKTYDSVETTAETEIVTESVVPSGEVLQKENTTIAESVLSEDVDASQEKETETERVISEAEEDCTDENCDHDHEYDHDHESNVEESLPSETSIHRSSSGGGGGSDDSGSGEE